METVPSDALQKLRLSATLNDEVIALKALQANLKPENCNANDPDEEWLAMAAENLGDDDSIVNPFPKRAPNQLFTRQDDLNQFTCYVFMRRFGWSEAINGETVQDSESLCPQREMLMIEKEAQFKGNLNELLDNFIKWYLSQPISQPLLESLRHTFNQAANKPVVRNQTIVHVMEWLIQHLDDEGLHRYINEVYPLMICGLTDIWSAIRNAAVSRLASVIDGCSLAELEVFFTSLAEICQSKDSTWQSTEGALMAITTILKQFQWTAKITSSLIGMPGGAQFILKFGKQELSQLPEFMTSRMHTIVYPLLAHRQLSIRENATKAFSAFLSRCEIKEAMASFSEAVTRLRHNTEPALERLNSESSRSSLPHIAVLRSDYKFLNAYEAEGLLGVCVYLIKHISPGILLPCWPEFCSTFNLYLMHPASTVRQATSAVFKYLVAKDSNNPSMLKLVLQALCADWDMNFGLLTQDTTSKSAIFTRDFQSNGSQQDTVDHRTGSLLPDMTVRNQGVCSENDLRHQRKRHLSGGKYCSITSLCQLDEENSESLFCKAWEWREGRLFAYELIVKFLIINHIHYLFPSFALPPSKFDGTVSTDDSMTPSHQSRMAFHQPIQKSLSHGGMSLRHSQVLTTQGAMRKTLSQGHPLIEQDERRDTVQECNDTMLEEVNEVVLTRSGSERKKKTCEEKRSRTMIGGAKYNKPMAKHYSYYTNSANSTTSDRLHSGVATASSLLEQARDMDKKLGKGFNVGKRNKCFCVRSPINTVNSHDMNSPTPDMAALLQSMRELEKQSTNLCALPDWLEHLELDSMSNLLCQMLLQTISCLGDSRWELRRMGHQALPLITECIRWYDMGILTSLWDDFFTPVATLGSYGCSLSLRFSIHHATKLDHFLEQPPASWKDPESCQRISMSIADAVHEGLPRWCAVAMQLVKRPITDKLSVVALEILMLANSFFPHLISERSTYERMVLDCFQHIFHHAHPTSFTSKLVKHQAFQTPINGCLSCCTRSASVKPYPQQLEKHLLSEIHSLLPVFVRSCQVDSAAALLPMLIYYIREYSGDEAIAKSVFEGSSLIVLGLTADRMNAGSCADFLHSIVENVQQTFHEISLVLQDKSLELSTVRIVLDMFLNLSQLMDGTEHLQQIFEAVAHRLELNGSLSSQQITVECPSEDKDTQFGNLSFMSNDIPTSPVDDPRISDEDEEDGESSGHNHMLSESVALNISSSSSTTQCLSMSGGEKDNRALTSSAVENKEDSASNWDSWDEEEEDQTMMSGLFSEFMKMLKMQYSQVEHPGGPSPFQVELTNTKDKDRRLITSLLNQ